MIQLRLAEERDYVWIMALRNDTRVMAGSYSQRHGHKIDWEEHVAWMKSRNQDWRNFIVLQNTDRVGVVNVGQLDSWLPQLGVYVSPDYWGKGIGKVAVQLLLNYVKEYGRDVCMVTILNDNSRSIALFESLGFVKIGSSRPDESWYHLKMG